MIFMGKKQKKNKQTQQHRDRQLGIQRMHTHQDYAYNHTYNIIKAKLWYVPNRKGKGNDSVQFKQFKYGFKSNWESQFQ